MSDVQTLPAAVRRRAEQQATAPAIRHRRRGEWRTVSWAELDDAVGRIAAALRTVPGTGPVAICGRQHHTMVAVDLAAQTVRRETLWLPSASSAGEVAATIAETGAELAFCGDASLAADLGALPAADRGTLRRIVVPDGTAIVQGEVPTVELTAFAADDPLTDVERSAGSGEDLAFAGFSRGRSGVPRMVRWTQRRAVAAASEIVDAGLIDGRDEVLTHFPFGHPAGALLGIYAPLMVGATLLFPEPGADVVEDMITRSPTVVVSTARLPELLLARHATRLRASRGVRRRLADWALRDGDAAARHGGLAMALIGRPVLRQMGFARTRAVITLFEQPSPGTVAFFGRLGVGLHAPFASADEGVVLAGDGATPGPPTIGDRPIAEREAALRSSPYIARAVIDDGADATVAYVEVEFETAAAWAQATDVPHTSYRSLVEHPRTVELVRGEAAARGVAAESVVIVPRPFDLDRGELTWLGTPRRAEVRQAFATVDARPVEVP